MFKEYSSLGRPMSIADMVQNMIDELNEAMADAVKSDNGNNAAMTLSLIHI